MVQLPTTLNLQPSFGFGDRTGLATPGHVAAMRKAGGGIQPIFAQQSIREMNRTGRSADQVLRDAMAAIKATGWDSAHGADADHLKSRDEIARTGAAGFTFFTLDPSEHVDQRADDYDFATVDEKFLAIREVTEWVDEYIGTKVTLPNGTPIDFDQLSVRRAAVKYGRAIEAAVTLATDVRELQEAEARPYEIELSVDETDQPTTLVEHYIIAQQCIRRGVKLVSLAPRFVGNMEKGVDYLGCMEGLESSLADHAAIARLLGPYKLSLHSGSDKLSMYPALAKATQGLFHVKTAGTSYLEALRVVAIEDVELFRDICQFARNRYEVDRATYHVHATLETAPAPKEVGDNQQLIDHYLERWQTVPAGQGFTASGRQILHCTFGSVLTDANLGAALRQCLLCHAETYQAVLEEHFVRHLQLLQV